jgi:hypothetical protein
MRPYKPWAEKIILQQAADRAASRDMLQKLEVTIEDSGEGHYVVIKTGRWAINGNQLLGLARYFKGLCLDADKSLDDAMEEVDFPGSDLLSGV